MAWHRCASPSLPAVLICVVLVASVTAQASSVSFGEKAATPKALSQAAADAGGQLLLLRPDQTVSVVVSSVFDKSVTAVLNAGLTLRGTAPSAPNNAGERLVLTLLAAAFGCNPPGGSSHSCFALPSRM